MVCMTRAWNIVIVRAQFGKSAEGGLAAALPRFHDGVLVGVHGVQSLSRLRAGVPLRFDCGRGGK